MTDTNAFSELAKHISWGSLDPSRQAQALQTLQSCPHLAAEQDEFGTTLLMIAADEANPEAVRQLCALGANTRARASTGDTPLICAVRGACDESSGMDTMAARAAIIDTLIQSGADPDQLGWQGCGALHCAVIYGFVDLVRHLLLGGADPEVRLCDPPSDENSIELAASGRFYGSEPQRHDIMDLLQHAVARHRL